jgi:hypothetical protein
MRPEPHGSYLLEHKKRLSVRRKAVTFVVGMKCYDGLVFCADTLESDGVTKTYHNKLSSFLYNDGTEDWGLCWGASGSSYTCDKFKDKMKMAFKKQKYNRSSIEDKIETCLGFIRQSYPASDEIKVVVGLFGKLLKVEPGESQYELNLYRGASNSECVSPVRQYCCAGMDVTLADFFLTNTYHPLMPISHGKRLGVFATNLMKRHADGVGGETDCVSHVIGGSAWHYAPESEVSDIEKEFTLSSLDESVSRYWMGFDTNQDLNELTQSELNVRRARYFINQRKPKA